MPGGTTSPGGSSTKKVKLQREDAQVPLVRDTVEPEMLLKRALCALALRACRAAGPRGGPLAVELAPAMRLRLTLKESGAGRVAA